MNPTSLKDQPYVELKKAGTDSKAEVTKSALAVAAVVHNWMAHRPNDSAADWLDGAYFKGDLPD